MDIVHAILAHLYAQATDLFVLIPTLLVALLAETKKSVLTLCLVIGSFFTVQSLISPLPPHAMRVSWMAPIAFVMPVTIGLTAFSLQMRVRRLQFDGQKGLPARLLLSFGAMLFGGGLCGGLAFGGGLAVIGLTSNYGNEGSALYVLALAIVPLVALVGGVASLTVAWRKFS